MKRFLPNALLVAVCFAPVASRAHVFPISYGTLELTSGKAQLRLRISVHNLHPALEAFTGRHLEMKDEGYDTRLMEAYFKGRLELVPPKGKVLQFRIAQQEIGIEEIVFILKAPLKNPKGWKLRNAVLFEQSRDQKNYVTLEQGGRRLGLIFDAQHPLLSLDAP
ncbi:MAG: hypothetical protein KGN80_00280 [Acidobacteriota bacterium]|nr:hypothetical protein [Acidobacteriota bacterium]